MTEECLLKEKGYRNYVAGDNISFRPMFFSTTFNQNTWINKKNIVIENTYLQVFLDKPGKPLVRMDTGSSAVEGMSDAAFPNCSKASSTEKMILHLFQIFFPFTSHSPYLNKQINHISQYL